MREALKLVITLGLVAAISGGMLGLFYNYTMPIVEARQMSEMIEKGFKGVLPDAHSFSPVTGGQGEQPEGVTEIYEGLDERGERIGIAFEAIGQGFEGPITMAIGVRPDTQTVVGVKILSHTETPGMGAKIEEEDFTLQFQEKSLSDPFVVGKDIDGITAATISSKAVAGTVGDKARQVLSYLGYEVAAPISPEPTEEATAGEGTPVEESGEQAGKPVEFNEEVAQELLPGAAEFIETALDGIKCFEAIDEDGQQVGLVLEAGGEGFGGPVTMAVAVDPEAEKILGIKILSHNETPGLGSRIEEEEFLRQFEGKSLSDSFAIGEDVDGITAATISSEAVAKGAAEKARQVIRLYK
ncbi:MAG: RnfABCDGE type electron transport complex subunit G [Clostridia bacterium]|nr:RnfABCDGE type electron transport complex subunit G [Clostridia bacterium]